ncbi:hypothetical protein DL93DRAFT_2067402, partial [Clavulina sp. PMI_390]
MARVSKGSKPPRKGDGPSPLLMYDSNMRPRNKSSPGIQPIRSEESQQLLILNLPINGLKAFICVDTGATLNAVTPEFAKVAGLTTALLDKPVPLQLACRGSKTQITAGTYSNMTIGTFSEKIYYDIVNVDRYDAVLGIPALRSMRASIDFASNTITIGGKVLRGLSNEEE